MIQGNGVDIVDLRRFRIMDQHRLDRLAKRILTDYELEDFSSTSTHLRHLSLAKYWAVKEAVSKAFGTGIRGTVVWKNIQMRKTHLGQPKIYFQPILHVPGRCCHVSISHDGDYLIAYAILEHGY